MIKSQDILSLIFSGEINPYEILGISKTNENLSEKEIRNYYKKRALVLHPDKTKGKTEIEFKILHICYKYLVSQLEQVSQNKKKYASVLRNKTELYNKNAGAAAFASSRESDDQLKEYYASYGASVNSNWDDASVRKKYLIDDTQGGVDEYLKSSEGKKKYTSYSSALKDSEIKNLIGKFNIDKFNAIFERMKGIQEGEMSLMKYDAKKLVPVHIQGDTTVTEIAKVDDVILVHKTKASKAKYQGMSSCSDVSKFRLTPDIVKGVSKKEIKAQKEQRVNPKKMSNSEIKKRISESRELNISKDDIETEDQFYARLGHEYAQHEQESSEFISKNLHIFPKALQNKIRKELIGKQMLYLDYNN